MKLEITLLLAALMLGAGTLEAKPPKGPGGDEEDAKKPGGKSGSGSKKPSGPSVKGKVVNPPGPSGGPGKRTVVNPPGPVGGPSKGTVRVNPPGPAGGPGKGSVRINPPGPVGGPSKGTVRVNPPGPAGGPGKGTVRVNPPGPAGGPGTSIRRLDSRSVLRGLSIVPRRIAPAVVIRPGAPLVVPGRPRTLVRVYDRTRNVVMVPAEDGQSAELPYIAVPVLFAVGTAELLDETADADLQALAEALLEIHVQEPGARFEIEGHTSTDGEDQDNLDLSLKRASHVYAVLVSRYHVPASILSTKGYGESYADYPNGTEEELQMDRRVLVVRTQ